MYFHEIGKGSGISRSRNGGFLQHALHQLQQIRLSDGFRYSSLFRIEQIHVMQLKRVNDRRAALRDLANFLEIDDEWDSELIEERHNEASQWLRYPQKLEPFLGDAQKSASPEDPRKGRELIRRALQRRPITQNALALDDETLEHIWALLAPDLDHFTATFGLRAPYWDTQSHEGSSSPT